MKIERKKKKIPANGSVEIPTVTGTIIQLIIQCWLKTIQLCMIYTDQHWHMLYRRWIRGHQETTPQFSQKCRVKKVTCGKRSFGLVF